MKKVAIVAAATAFMTTPAMSQYFAPEPYAGVDVYAAPYAAQPAYTYPAPVVGPYAYAPPYAASAYSRELDMMIEPDPNVRMDLRREQQLSDVQYD